MQNRFHMWEFCAVAQVGDGVCVFIRRESGRGRPSTSMPLSVWVIIAFCACAIFCSTEFVSPVTGRHSIGKRVLLVGIDLVLFQHGWAAASIANAGLHVIQRQIDLIGAGQLIGMGFAVQFEAE